MTTTINWKSIDQIKHHGADWCVAPCADDVPLPKLTALVDRINEIITESYAAGRRDQQAIRGQTP